MKQLLLLLPLMLLSYWTKAQDAQNQQTGMIIEQRMGYYAVDPQHYNIVRTDTMFHANTGFRIDQMANIETFTATDGKQYVRFHFPNFTKGKVYPQQKDDTSNTINAKDTVTGEAVDAPISVELNTEIKANNTTYFPYNGRYLAIEKEVFDQLTKLNVYKTWRPFATSGILSIPFKLRPAVPDQGALNWDFSTDVTLGPYIGLTFRTSKYKDHFLTFPLTLGLAFINLNNNTVTNTAPDSSGIDVVPGITGSIGMIYQFDNFNLGLVAGIDSAPGANQRWIYDGRPWLSFSIGYNFLQKTEPKD